MITASERGLFLIVISTIATEFEVKTACRETRGLCARQAQDFQLELDLQLNFLLVSGFFKNIGSRHGVTVTIAAGALLLTSLSTLVIRLFYLYVRAVTGYVCCFLHIVIFSFPPRVWCLGVLYPGYIVHVVAPFSIWDGDFERTHVFRDP